MSDPTKVKPTHTHRAAVIYVRQSSTAQVEHNRESTERQYALVHRAIDLGWHREQVVIIDDDLGVSGSGIAKRAGFARLAADVALAKVGIVVGLEVSRLARNNADWYRLLDLCAMTDTCSRSRSASSGTTAGRAGRAASSSTGGPPSSGNACGPTRSSRR